MWPLSHRQMAKFGALRHNQETWHCTKCLDRNLDLPWYSNILRIDLGQWWLERNSRQNLWRTNVDAGMVKRRSNQCYLTRRYYMLLLLPRLSPLTAMWLARCPCPDCYISVTPRHSPGETQGRLLYLLLHLYLAPISLIDASLLPLLDRPEVWLIRLRSSFSLWSR